MKGVLIDAFLCVLNLVVVLRRDFHSLELTFPANTLENPVGARCRNQAKKHPLITDLESHPHTRKVSYATIEVGLLGHYLLSAVQALCEICPYFTIEELN